MLNGPNLNRLGKREPHIYGEETLVHLENELTKFGEEHSCQIVCKQSNHEGELIDWLHVAETQQYIGIIFNPGAFTHYSYALRDAIASITTPVIEVHLSNVHTREPFRHVSVISPVTIGQIVGLGFQGYRLAAQALLEL